MPCYRLFFREPDGQRFVESEVLEDCPDDRTALILLADRLSGRDVELWERERLVAVLRAMPGGLIIPPAPPARPFHQRAG